MTKIIRIGLATARLSRLVTSDKLGDWLIVRPAKNWAMRHEGEETIVVATEQTLGGEEIPTVYEGTGEPDEENGWRSKLVSGLECPFCVGFWIGAGMLAADAVLPDQGMARRLYDFGTAALALNYVVGHASAELD